jgi:anti-sigma factor RsiW
MSVHCSLEMLSTYVDAELADSERREVESHVKECEECRNRLSHLEGVVGQLKRLELVEAPPTLGGQVQRRLRLDGSNVPLRRRFEDRLGGLLRQPLFAPLFALILAFGAILYMFSLGVARQTVSGTRVVIGGSAPSSAEDLAHDDESGVRSERRIEEAESPARPAVPSSPDATTEAESKVGPEAVAAAPDESFSDVAGRLDRLAAGDAPAAMRSRLEAIDVLQLVGREFRLIDGIWREVGLGEREPESRIDPLDGGVLPPEIEGLASRMGTYWVLLEGRVIEVVIRRVDAD